MIKCPVCSGSATELGSVDANKSCADEKRRVFPVAEELVVYVQCNDCGLTWCPEMLQWPQERYMKQIYNEDYVKVDPDYVEARPEQNAAYLHRCFGTRGLVHLDYGGGNGFLSNKLREDGWDSTSFDPLEDEKLPSRQYDLVTAFEVFEHAPDPQKLIRDMIMVTGNRSAILFSTLTSDHIGNPLKWWYLAPRNGHVMLYTKRALARLLAKGGFHLLSLSPGTHVACRTMPIWMEKALTGR